MPFLIISCIPFFFRDSLAHHLEMAIWEGKRYKLVSSENFDEYMRELGK